MRDTLVIRPRLVREQVRWSLLGMGPARARLRNSPAVDDDASAPTLLNLLGVRGWVELLAMLELPERERATLIGQPYRSERGQALLGGSPTSRATPTTSRGCG